MADRHFSHTFSRTQNTLASFTGEWTLSEFVPEMTRLIQRGFLKDVDPREVDPFIDYVSAVFYTFRIRRNFVWHIFAWIIPTDFLTFVGLFCILAVPKAGPQLVRECLKEKRSRMIFHFYRHSAVHQ